MLILEKELEVPQTPDPTWGVELRKLKLKDFSYTIKLGIFTALFAVVSFVPALSQVEFREGQFLGELGLFFLFFSGFVNLILFACSMSTRKEEAISLSNARANEWVESVLKPYIEDKYGVKFYRGNPFSMWSWPSVQFEGRTIEIRIHGVEQKRSYRFSEDIGHDSYTVSPDGIWIEEIITPSSVSYKRMKPVPHAVEVS